MKIKMTKYRESIQLHIYIMHSICNIESGVLNDIQGRIYIYVYIQYTPIYNTCMYLIEI